MGEKMNEQAVLIYLPTPADEEGHTEALFSIYELEEALEEALETLATDAEVDGHDYPVDAGEEAIIHIYGADAEVIAAAVTPVLRRLWKGAPGRLLKYQSHDFEIGVEIAL